MTTTPRPIRPATLLLLSLAIASPAASGGGPSAALHHEPGDALLLSLRSETRTDASSSGGARAGSFAKDARVDYSATAFVLETDATGAPVRERHEGVVAGYRSPEGSGLLVERGAVLEVVRRGPDQVHVLAGGERLEPRAEALLAGILEERFQLALVARLLEPARGVEVGEAWPLDPDLSRRLLRAQGIRVVGRSGAGEATLESRSEEDAVIRYRMPVAWFELEEAPAAKRVSGSDAHLEGRLRIPAASSGRPVSHTSRRVVRLQGVAGGPGPRSAWNAWSVESARLADQRITPVPADAAPAAPAARR